MALPREGPNPLRPYYSSPSMSAASDIPQDGTYAASLGSKYPSTSTNSFGSSARNILADMDYSEYITDSSPSASSVAKNLMEQAAWKYTSVFLAQPFEVAKTVLQVQMQAPAAKRVAGTKATLEEDMRRQPGNYRLNSYETNDVCSQH